MNGYRDFRAVVWFFFPAIVVVLPARVCRGEDLRERIREGNRAAIEAIQTLSVTLTCTDKLLDSGDREAIRVVTGQYWRSPKGVRVKSKSDRVVSDSFQNNSRVVRIAHHPDQSAQPEKLSASIIADKGMAIPECDAWPKALFVFPSLENLQLLPIGDLLNSRAGQVSRRNEGNQSFIVAAFDKTSTHQEMWFDPEVNYLARYCRVKQSAVGSPLVFEYLTEIVQFAEPIPGIFFPQKVETRSFRDGQLIRITTTEFFDIAINQPQAAELFDFRLPEGILVHDTIQRKRYRVDSNGSPIGESFEVLSPGPPRSD